MDILNRMFKQKNIISEGDDLRAVKTVCLCRLGRNQAGIKAVNKAVDDHEFEKLSALSERKLSLRDDLVQWLAFVTEQGQGGIVEIKSGLDFTRDDELRLAVSISKEDFERLKPVSLKAAPVRIKNASALPAGAGSETSKSSIISILLTIAFIVLVVLDFRLLGSFATLLTIVVTLVAALLALRAPFTAKNAVGFLLAAPLAVIAAYGWLIFLTPNTIAKYVVPAAWEWPVQTWPQDTRYVYVLKSGKRVVNVHTSPRIQVYDEQGRYLGGWFVKAAGRNGWVEFSGLGETDDGREAVWVATRISLNKRRATLYDLDGRVVSEKKHDSYADVGEKAEMVKMAFITPWYKLPLVSLKWNIICVVAGTIGLRLLRRCGLLKKKG